MPTEALAHHLATGQPASQPQQPAVSARGEPGFTPQANHVTPPLPSHDRPPCQLAMSAYHASSLVLVVSRGVAQSDFYMMSMMEEVHSRPKVRSAGCCLDKGRAGLGFGLDYFLFRSSGPDFCRAADFRDRVGTRPKSEPESLPPEKPEPCFIFARTC